MKKILEDYINELKTFIKNPKENMNVLIKTIVGVVLIIVLLFVINSAIKGTVSFVSNNIGGFTPLIVFVLIGVAIKVALDKHREKIRQIIERQFKGEYVIYVELRKLYCEFDKRSELYESQALKYFGQGNRINYKGNSYVITERFIYDSPKNPKNRIIKANFLPDF